MSDVADLAESLSAALDPVLGMVEVVELRRLTGGASRETWSFDALDASGTVHPLVLRRDPPRRPGEAGAMAQEASCIRAASAAGLPVPEVLLDSEDPATWGSAGIVMVRIEGETIARRILRDDRYATARAGLAADCGRFLAGLHAIDPTTVGGFGSGSAPDPLRLLRQTLDQIGEPSPTFELAIRWLTEHRPPPSGPPVVVHGDFRLGNLIVDEDGLRSVLDWELAHLGDPVEDLGWLCVRAWRFGQEPAVGGFGDREALVDAYVAAGGVEIDPEVLHWWEVFNTLRWGVVCLVQASVHLNGLVRSVELAAIGRRVCETEWDLLLLLAPEVAADVVDGAAPSDAPPIEELPGADLHGRPTSVELLEAVSDFLRDDVMANTDGRMSFQARVAANVVDMVSREVAAGWSQPLGRAAALEAAGCISEAGLAESIRAGGPAMSSDSLYRLLADGVFARVSVANPRYF